MEIRTVTDFVLDFVKSTEPFFGPCQVTISEKLDAAIYPDEVGKFGNKRCGLYIMSTKEDSVVRYVGISANIESRIYSHIGRDFIWARNGQSAHFPNCELSAGRLWQQQEEVELLRKAKWEITAVFFDPSHMAGLLEMAIIHFGKVRRDGPTINVVFGDG
jgi:hypothetical protein